MKTAKKANKIAVFPDWEKTPDRDKVRLFDYFSGLADLLNTPDSVIEEKWRKRNEIRNEWRSKRVQSENVDGVSRKDSLSVLSRQLRAEELRFTNN